MTRRSALCLTAALVAATLTCTADAAQKPKVRAITAFVRLDRAQYQQQIRSTLEFLRRARAGFEQAGYEVQTVRITTQPFAEYTRDLPRSDALGFFRAYDQLAQKEGFDANLGPAMLSDSDDERQAELLAQVLSEAKALNASLIIAADDGIHWKSIRAAARLIKYLEEHSEHSQANFNFAATAMLPPLAPFYPGSYHTGAGKQFTVALQSANVVEEAFASARDPETARRDLESSLGAHARAIEKTGQRLARETGWSYAGLDLSPAPLKEVSIGAAIEKLTRAPVGASGTMTAVAIITAALHAIPVRQTGYSGLMLPVLEDATLSQRWAEGTLSIDALLAYSAVCGTGLDTIPLPGDVPVEQVERILGDVASLAVKWHKPLSARLLPVAGKKAGDRTDFNDPFLVNTTLRAMP